MSPGSHRVPGLIHAATETFAVAVVAAIRIPLDIRDWNDQRTGRRRRSAGTPKEKASCPHVPY